MVVLIDSISYMVFIATIQFGQVEVVSATILEHFPDLKKRKELVVLAVCLSLFLLGLSCVSYVSITTTTTTTIIIIIIIITLIL